MIKTHLEGYHGIKEDSPIDTRVKNVQIDIEKAMELTSKHPHKRQKLNDLDSGSQSLDRDVIKVLFVKFITACNIPLYLVECWELRAFLTYLNSDVDH